MSKTFILTVIWNIGILIAIHAQTTFIKGDNTNALNTAASYTTNSGVPTAADTIQIDSTLTAARTAVLGGSFSVNGITVPTNYAQRFTFGSTTGATLTIGAGGISKTNTSVAMNLGCSVALSANQTWNIGGSNLVFNGPTPIINTGGFNLLVTGGGALDLRPTTAFTCGPNVTINSAQVYINAAAADVTFAGTNTYKNLLIVQGTAQGSTFPADTNSATTSHFGNASSGTITFGSNSTASATLIYNGNTASTPKTFTYDARNTSAANIKVSTTGQTLTITSNLLLSNGATQTSDKNWNFGGAGNLTLNGPVTNASGSSFKIGVTKNDAGTLTLRGANTYTGDTIINGGTLAVNGSGTLASTPNIVVAGGATLDVSGMSSSLAIGAGRTLGNSAAATGVLKGNINASGGKLAVTFNGTAPALSIGGGTLTLSGSTVVQVSGAIPVGTYHLITTTAGGSVTGSLPAITLYRATGYLQFSATGLDLVVTSGDPFHYYVAPDGNDTTGDGTQGMPWQSITKVRDYLRTLGSQSADITVYLRGGRYELTSTLPFTNADSGTNGHYITYQSQPGERATISGGKRVTGWTQVPGQPYWVANVPTTSGFADYFRQLYVNGVRAERARSDWLPGAKYFWVTGGTYSYSTANSGLAQVDGIAFATTAGLKTYSNVSDLRLYHIKDFKVDEFPILSITNNAGNICVALQQPYCQNRYDYAPGYFNATAQFMIVGAFEELDEPGEWYLNRSTQQVYYYPNSFEDMNTAVVYAPVIEKLVDISGTSPTNRAQNLRFQNLTFEHNNWLFPRDNYFGGGEAQSIYYHPTTKELPGAIKATNTTNLQFLGNTIQHLGSCGIHLWEATQDTLIQGNIFRDLTAAAVLNGHFQSTTTLCTNTTVADNVVRAIGLDYLGGCFLDNLGGYGFQAVRNDMADCSYDGFHQHNGVASVAANTLGHGAVTIAYNRMAMAMTGARYGVQDGGFIYTNGTWPNTLITRNDLYDMNQPNAGMWTFGLYQDYDTYDTIWSYNVMRDFYPGIKGGNWQGFNKVDWPATTSTSTFTYTDATVRLTTGLTTFNNYFTFPVGSPSAAAQAIIQAAGVGPSYTGLLERNFSGVNLSRGKTTTASSNAATSQNAADWTYSTTWHSATGDTGCWWSVDLGTPYVLQRLELVPRTDLDEPDARASFQVQASNDATFATYAVLGEQGSVPFAYKTTNLRNSWLKYPNNPNGYRYLRVKKTSGSVLGFSEVQLYGYPAPTPGQLTWDASATGSVTDGSGPWNGTDQWWNGSSNQTWADNNDVVIGKSSGAAGTVTITGNSPQLNSLTFNAATSGSYTVSGAAIQLSGSTITTNANAALGNNLTTTAAFIKAGAATLTLSGATTFAGDVTVNAGTLSLSNPTFAASTAVNLSLGTTLNLNFNGTKNIATLRINGLQASGVWGSLTSTAANKTALITGPGLLNITAPAPPYEAWALASGLDNSTTAKNAATTADSNNDGENNLLEYATGQNPLSNSRTITTLTKTGNVLDFIYTKKKSATDVTYTVEWSDTLSNNSWSSANITTTVLTDNPTTQQIKATMPAGSGKRFMRLKVSYP